MVGMVEDFFCFFDGTHDQRQHCGVLCVLVDYQSSCFLWLFVGWTISLRLRLVFLTTLFTMFDVQ